MCPCRRELLDQINIYALHTKPALEEIKKLDPYESNTGFLSTTGYHKFRLDIGMDLALTLYELTKEPPKNKLD